MYLLKLFLLTFALLLTGFSDVAHSQPVLKYNITASGSHYPYSTNNPKLPGILPEVIEQVLKTAHINAEHVDLPAKRITKYLSDGLIDFDVISLSWLPESERKNSHYVFSNPLLSVSESIISSAQNTQQWQTVASLQNKNVGTVLGYYYHNDKEFNRVDFPSEKELITALNLNRVDVAIAGDLPALYWANKLGIEIAFGAQHSYGLMRIRLISKHADLLPAINIAIDTLNKEGFIKQVEDKYMQSIPTQNLRD
ncbi:hypothetical protein PspMM1_28920 [Pseudoalteromonas sp. MM1]|uniref:substrate-binding periplasmic protein n=1 Tax=Pseudoalteromonas sp. MM1 TaxID=3036714 RepID=UPI002572F325|nr:transporter substrate-binding domain-containing protein [Pseudoalteromonas sp. MM1]BED90424.1 hypothetical protein PspMM1_28920 [Pseudoalteromonas sp. MM1]